jgi:hypothetical protein
MMANLAYEDRIKLVGEYQKWALNYVINTFFADPPSMPDCKIYNSATSTFIDTGSKKFAATNNHVIQQYENLIKTQSNINYQLGPLVINDINSRIIDRNKFYDLVTYELLDEEINSLGKQYCPFTPWPPAEVRKDELLFFAGYPGIWRNIKSPGKVYFQSAIFIEEIISTSPESFKIHLDIDNYKVLLGPRKFEELTDYGGFSGAGVFRINDKKQIATLEPVGIIYEGSDNWKLQFASHISVIDENGIIKTT